MKFDFTCEQGPEGPYITKVDPNDTLQMPLPCLVISVNDKHMVNCGDFKKAYEDAAAGDHKFFMLIQYNGVKSYYNLPITE